MASSLLNHKLALDLIVVSHPVVTRALVAQLLAMLTEHEPIDLYVVSVGEHGLFNFYTASNRCDSVIGDAKCSLNDTKASGWSPGCHRYFSKAVHA